METMKSKLLLFASLTLFQIAFFLALAKGEDGLISWLPGFLQALVVVIYQLLYFIPLAIIVGTFFERQPENIFLWGVFFLLPVMLIYSLILSVAIWWVKSKFVPKRPGNFS